MSRHKRTARLIAEAEQRMRDDMWRADDADAYGPRLNLSPAFKAEAARQWDAIPDTPAEIAAWMRGEPINPKVQA
jgi:hypothetical protein